MIYGYARVSTRLQKVAGFSLNEQEQSLLQVGCERIYKDTYTGKTSSRPELDALKAVLEHGDTFICTKLDRFCRSVAEGQKLAEELLEKGVTIKILNFGTIDNTASGRLMFQTLLAFAEYERNLIIERTREGKAIAKTRPGYKEGRPPTDPKKIKAALELLQDGKHTVQEVCDIIGISRSTLLRARKGHAENGNK